MRAIPLLTAFFCLNFAIYAQEGPYSRSGFGYFSVDRPHGTSFGETLTAGGGGEFLFYKGLGVLFDVGYTFPKERAGLGFGLASLNGVYSFVNRDNPGKLQPFVTAGYGIAFRTGYANLFNYGGGVNYWFSRRVGLRTEVRDYRDRYSDFSLAFRVGLSFR